jgi:hypothetical protein
MGQLGSWVSKVDRYKSDFSFLMIKGMNPKNLTPPGSVRGMNPSSFKAELVHSWRLGH